MLASWILNNKDTLELVALVAFISIKCPLIINEQEYKFIDHLITLSVYKLVEVWINLSVSIRYIKIINTHSDILNYLPSAN